MQRELWCCPKGVLLQLFAVQLRVEQQCPSVNDPDLQQLLEIFQDLFEEPVGLPSVRRHDHKIPLIEGSSLVNVQPYKYPHYQKMRLRRSL
jgi:hypothetical protein